MERWKGRKELWSIGLALNLSISSSSLLETYTREVLGFCPNYSRLDTLEPLCIVRGGEESYEYSETHNMKDLLHNLSERSVNKHQISSTEIVLLSDAYHGFLCTQDFCQADRVMICIIGQQSAAISILMNV